MTTTAGKLRVRAAGAPAVVVRLDRLALALGGGKVHPKRLRGRIVGYAVATHPDA